MALARCLVSRGVSTQMMLPRANALEKPRNNCIASEKYKFIPISCLDLNISSRGFYFVAISPRVEMTSLSKAKINGQNLAAEFMNM